MTLLARLARWRRSLRPRVRVVLIGAGVTLY